MVMGFRGQWIAKRDNWLLQVIERTDWRQDIAKDKSRKDQRVTKDDSGLVYTKRCGPGLQGPHYYLLLTDLQEQVHRCKWPQRITLSHFAINSRFLLRPPELHFRNSITYLLPKTLNHSHPFIHPVSDH